MISHKIKAICTSSNDDVLCKLYGILIHNSLKHDIVSMSTVSQRVMYMYS